MSKLFNTLEKIRHHETSSEPTRRSAGRKPSPAERSGPPRLLSWVLVAMLTMVVLYTVLLATRVSLAPLGTHFRQALTSLRLLPAPDSSRTAQPAAPALPGAIPPGAAMPASAAEEALRHSASGIESFRNSDHWRSLYHFDQARQKNPRAVEPLINMAVVLSELGLYGPANRLFREAYARDPEDPALRRNLAILAEAGRLDDALHAKIRGPEPGSAAKR
ncbi:MAG: hypothetical protein AB1413_00200 [Thermodesulfobacteriota bacterium]